MRPELLKCFIAAADSGSFSAAARSLGKHLATVSGNIARLEDELGVELFDRTGKYPEITSQGLSLYDSARVAVDSIERFNLNALHLSSGVPALFTLAIDQDLPLQPFQNALAQCHKNWPHLQVTLIKKTCSEILIDVSEGKVDLALTPSLEGNSNFYEFVAIGHWNAHFCCHKTHPLGRKRTISNDDLLSSTQIIPRAAKTESALLDAYKMSSSIWYVDGYNSMVEVLKAGIGWAMLPNGNVSLPETLVTFHPEFAQTTMMMQYDLIWPKNQPKNKVHEHFIAAIGQVFND
nr:LysR family transcriptional regulator [Vibrio mediterranei]